MEYRRSTSFLVLVLSFLLFSSFLSAKKYDIPELGKPDSPTYYEDLRRRALWYFGHRVFLKACLDFKELKKSGETGNIKKAMLASAFIRCAKAADGQSEISLAADYLSLYEELKGRDKESASILSRVLKKKVLIKIEENISLKVVKGILDEANQIKKSDYLIKQIVDAANKRAKKYLSLNQKEEASSWIMFSLDLDPLNEDSKKIEREIWDKTYLAFILYSVGLTILILVFSLHLRKRNKLNSLN